MQPRFHRHTKPGSALSHAINQQQSFGLARKCRRKKLEMSISVEKKFSKQKHRWGKKLMFEGHFPISLRLYKYEKNNYDLKIHQDAPHVLAISLCAFVCIAYVCMCVSEHADGCTHVCACMFIAYVCLCAYMCVWVYTCMCLYFHVCADGCAHVCVHCMCVHCICGGWCTHACVCAHVYRWLCACVWIGVHVFVFIACVCICMCVGCTRVCGWMCACGWVCACGWLCTHVCVHCICVCMCVCVQMGVHVCVCTHLCVSALSGAHKMELYC